MSHPLVLALFDSPSSAASAARALRALGIPQERVSIVARSHDEEGVLARASDASPGSEIEDSRPAGRLGELSAHLLAAIALIVPGIGPIVADGPLAAGLGEAAGHLAGGLAPALVRAGLNQDEAEQWEARVEQGAVLIGAHVGDDAVEVSRELMTRLVASLMAYGRWDDT